MKLTQSIVINLKKLTKYKGKALFLILPITLLVCLGIAITSQAKNIQNAAEESVFGTVEDQARLIVLRNSEAPAIKSGAGFSTVRFDGEDSSYSQTDLEQIRAIENVSAADMVVSVPVDNITVNDLFENTSFDLSQLSGVDSELASMYTSTDFSYDPSQPIPIILNAKTFVRLYEDWKNQTEIEITMARPGSGSNANVEVVENQMPVKREAIDYDKDSLIGKEFTIEFGSLDELATYSTTPTDSGIKFTKYTDDEIKTKEDERKSAISTYWNYDKLNTPIKYTFKVVGVIESESNFASYVPADFANKLMQDYIQNQLDARNETAIDTNLLNSTFKGLTYDGVELSASSPFSFGGGGSFKVMVAGPGGPQSPSDSISYTIPGFVIQTKRDENASGNKFIGNTSEATGEYTDPKVFESASRSSDTILIKVADIYSREGVVKKLNELGFAYQDISKTDIFNEIKSTMKILTIATTVSFIVLSLVVIVFTMGKFVSESRKEIGVFRAIGATKFDIKKIFILQAIIYSAIGYILGSLLGFGLTIILAKPIQTWFDSFVGDTIKEAFNVVNPVGAGIFTHIDWQTFGIFSGLLLLITIIISIIPAIRASQVSPVEAIRGE